MNSPVQPLALGLLALLAPLHGAHGQTLRDLYPEVATVVGSDSSAFDGFGGSVAISGNTMVVGVPYDTVGPSFNRGSVHVFVRTGSAWSQQAIITPSDGGQGDLFGWSVALSGDTLAVGAPGQTFGANSAQGSVRIFTREAGVWTQRTTLTATDGAINDYFGYDVALSGSSLAVGVIYDDVSGRNDQGSVRTYELADNTWTFQQTITAADGAAGDEFGTSVAIEGDTLVVGAPRDDAPAFNQGSVRVFSRVGGSWQPQQTVVAADGVGADLFGVSVALSGDTVAVGVPGDQVGANGSQGSVRVFTRSGTSWTAQGTLTAPDGVTGDLLGGSLSIFGDVIAVGNTYDRVGNNSNQGSVRVFTRSGGTWGGHAMLTAQDGAATDYFGYQVAVSNDAIAVGVFGDTVGAAQAQGSVRVFGNYQAWNQTRGIGSTTLASAVGSAFAGDRLLVGGLAFSKATGIINASQKPLTFTALEPLTLGSTALMSVASDTMFEKSPAVAAGGLTIAGKLSAPPNGTLLFEEMSVGSGGQFLQRGATVLANQGVATGSGGVSYLQGQVLAEAVSTSAGAQNRVMGDTDILSNYTNAGSTIIQRGVLYIYGSLTNTGTITGQYNTGLLPPNPGDGYSIGGDYTVGAESSIILAEPVWWLRVGGDFDIAINHPSRFVMDQATLELTGVGPKGAQSLEVFCRDFGAVDSGFATTNYLLGALRLRSGSNVSLVNNHGNAAGKGAEAIYTKELVVPAGATLETNGYRIYTRAATIAGSVSNPGDIVVVPDLPSCPADVVPDGIVNSADLGVVLAGWGPCTGSNCFGDINRDGQVDSSDLGFVLSAWGGCAD